MAESGISLHRSSLKGEARRFSADSALPPCTESPNFERLEFLDSLRRTDTFPLLALAFLISNCQELYEMAWYLWSGFTAWRTERIIWKSSRFTLLKKMTLGLISFQPNLSQSNIFNRFRGMTIIYPVLLNQHHPGKTKKLHNTHRRLSPYFLICVKHVNDRFSISNSSQNPGPNIFDLCMWAIFKISLLLFKPTCTVSRIQNLLLF